MSKVNISAFTNEFGQSEDDDKWCKQINTVWVNKSLVVLVLRLSEFFLRMLNMLYVGKYTDLAANGNIS